MAVSFLKTAMHPSPVFKYSGIMGTTGFVCDCFTRRHVLPNDLAYNCESAEYRDKPAPFPETPEGQRQFLEEVHRLALNTPHNRGKGVFWWEPAAQRGGHRTGYKKYLHMTI